MFNKSDQGVSTLDTLSIIISVVVIALIVVPILSHRVDGQYTEIAKHQAQEWSQKISVVEKLSDESSKELNDREVASVKPETSTIGADPWGQPFYYQYARNAQGQAMYVVVWSAGPNTKNETANSKIAVNEQGFLTVDFVGDDVGYIRAVR